MEAETVPTDNIITGFVLTILLLVIWLIVEKVKRHAVELDYEELFKENCQLRQNISDME